MPKTTVIVQPHRQEVMITRTFATTPERLFATLTNPRFIPQWWGPADHTTVVDAMDVTPGGVWRFVSHDGDGNEFAFRGVYHAVEPPARLVYTFEFEGAPGHVLLESITLEEEDDGTFMSDHSVFQSVSDRDMMVGTGLEQNAGATMDRLATLLDQTDDEFAG